MEKSHILKCCQVRDKVKNTLSYATPPPLHNNKISICPNVFCTYNVMVELSFDANSTNNMFSILCLHPVVGKRRPVSVFVLFFMNEIGQLLARH